MSHPGESTHWYNQKGKPSYTVIGKNGKERNTTLRDARTMDLVPSVTTVMNIIAKPGLERWKIDQALMAALTLPKLEGESLDDFKRRALEDSKEHAKSAAERGTRIHTAIQGYYENERVADEDLIYAKSTVDAINKLFPNREWIAEEAFASQLGYGGKVDLHCHDVVIDFKTKEFGPDDKVKAFDEQIMQLDAYRNGLNLPYATIANVYVSVSNPGLVKIVVHEESNHFEQFMHLLQFWQLSKGYCSSFSKLDN